MTGSWPLKALPNLTDQNHTVTSPATGRYNCIAWAAGDDTRKWWPDPFYIGYWPPGAQRGETLQDFVGAYSKLGYAPCINGALVVGTEKIAIFSTTSAPGQKPTHAAIQLEGGKWSSKLGDFEDIAHADVTDIEGPDYGQVVAFMSRPRPGYT